jgi:hypothetical protein
MNALMIEMESISNILTHFEAGEAYFAGDARSIVNREYRPPTIDHPSIKKQL